ncbi:MAG: Mini-ribonuclease 3 [Lachnospiraceae bacterium]
MDSEKKQAVFFPMSEYSKKLFELKQVDINTYSPLALAFIGDSVYELMIRTLVLNQHNTNVNILNKKKSMLVKAAAQAQMAYLLMPYLTEQEQQVFKRGRNAKSGTSAKNASIQDYRVATGLEALFGWLYLSGEHTRALELLKLGLDSIEKEKK